MVIAGSAIKYPGVMVFNPSTDNAFLEDIADTELHTTRLKNWRDMLGRSKSTGGSVIQVLSAEPSLMQEMRVSVNCKQLLVKAGQCRTLLYLVREIRLF